MEDHIINRWVFIVCLVITLLMLSLALTYGGERPKPRERKLPWLGNPTSRVLIGKRQIDGYKDRQLGVTVWYEGNHVVRITR